MRPGPADVHEGEATKICPLPRPGPRRFRPPRPGIPASAIRGRSAPPAIEEDHLKGRRPVLVVDDDPRTLRFVRDALAQAGYAPIATGDPRRAFAIRQDAAALPRPARPDATRRRRRRAHGDHPRAGRCAGHLHLRLRARRDRRQGAKEERCRLSRQALLGDRADGADPGGAPQVGRARDLRPRRSRSGLRGVAGHRGRLSGAADHHRVRTPGGCSR